MLEKYGQANVGKLQNGSLTDDVVDFDKISLTAPKKLVENRQSLLSEQAQSMPKLNKHLNGKAYLIVAVRIYNIYIYYIYII